MFGIVQVQIYLLTEIYTHIYRLYRYNLLWKKENDALDLKNFYSFIVSGVENLKFYWKIPF